MESRQKIAKYLPRDGRVVSVGVDAALAREIADTTPVACYDDDAAFVAGAEGDLDAIILVPGTATRNLLDEAPRRLKAKGVVVVSCATACGARLLEGAGVAHVVQTLSEAGYSILAPPRWLDHADGDSLLVAARHDGYLIRGYAPGDEAQILDLFETSFFHRRPVEHWSWEFEENPFGRHAISMAFDGDAQLVAQYAGYPVPLSSTDATIDGLCAHQIGDNMTAMRIRNVGRGHTSLLVRTAKHFFATRCVGKVAFNYGWVTGNSRKMSFGFIEVHPVEPAPFRRAEVAALRPPTRASRIGKTLLNAYSVSHATAVDAEFDRFFHRVAPSYGMLVRRDRQYLQWRYLDSPVWKYEIITLRSAGRLVGWAAFRRRDDTLIWGDALFSPRHADAAGLALEHALAAPIGRGATHVEGWFPARPAWWAGELDALGLTLSQEPNDLWFGCTPFVLEDAAERLRRELYYTACDSDLY
ncbi:MAG: hypothetical protein ACSLFQ_03500 [Thermoanaerobaculia bacterium]